MSAGTNPDLLPIAMGNEEESMLMTGPRPDLMRDPTDFMAGFKNYIPTELGRTGGAQVYLQNGSMMYDGGAIGTQSFAGGEPLVNLERATPECASPRELATYIQASEKIYIDMLKNYVTEFADYKTPMRARAHRRTADSYGNWRASHDNFEVRDAKWLEGFNENAKAQRVLGMYLLTRSFITGAGYVTEGGAHYAQKIQTLHSINSYGFGSSAFRNASENLTGPRLEIRLNDINISPWQIQVRVGETAMLLAMLQTPIIDELETMAPTLGEGQMLQKFREHNYVYLHREDGWRIALNPSIAESMAFQEHACALMDGELPKYADVPDDYRALNVETMSYIDDFRKVMHGDAPLDLLADRSDMAAKFSHMLEVQDGTMHGDDEQPGPVMGDLNSRALDLMYDQIAVRPRDDGSIRVNRGYGIRRRDKGGFRLTPTAEEVATAYSEPPQKTRAKERGDMIRQGADTAGWNWVKFPEDVYKVSLSGVWRYGTRPEEQDQGIL